MAKERRKGRLRRRLLAAGAVLAALVAAAVGLAIAFRGPILDRHVLKPLTRDIGEILGLEVSAGKASYGLDGRIVLSDVRARGPSPRTGLSDAFIPRLEIDVSPLGLIAGRRDWLGPIIAHGPRISLDLDRKPLVPPPEGKDGGKGGGGIALPAIALRDAEVRLAREGETVDLRGVDASFAPPALSLSVAGAEGRWSLPPLEAFRFPIEARGTVAPGPDPFREIRVDRLSIGGEEAARDVRIDLSRSPDVAISGVLPALGLTAPEIRIAPGRLDLAFHLRGTPLRDAMAFIPGSPPVSGRATGALRASIPLPSGLGWTAGGQADIEEPSWGLPGEEAISARRVTTEFHAPPGVPGLEGDLSAEGVSVRGSIPIDIEGAFRRERFGDDDFYLDFERVTVRRGEGLVNLRGSLRERDLSVEDGRIEIPPLPVALLGAALPDLADIEGTVETSLSFKGVLPDPATYAASGRLTLKGLREAGSEGPAIDLALSGDLEDCLATVRDALLTRGPDRIGFSLSAQTTLPARIEFSRIDGIVASLPFRAEDPPAVDIDRSGFFVSPGRFRLLGGALQVRGEGDFGEEGLDFLSAGIAASGLDISEVLRRMAPALEPRAVLTADLDFRAIRAGGAVLPDLSLEWRVEGGAATIEGRRIEGIGIEGRLSADDRRAVLDDLEVFGRGDVVRLTGDAPLRWTPYPELPPGEPAEARLRVEVGDIARLPIPAGQIREVAGRLAVRAMLRGPLVGGAGPPEISGSVTLSGGTLKLLGDLPPMTGIEARLALQGNRAVVENFTGNVVGSYVVVTGSAAVGLPWDPPGPPIRSIDLALVSQDALLYRSPELRARGDVSLRWTGPWESMSLGGDVKVTRATFYRNISLNPAGRRGPDLPLNLFSIAQPPLRDLRLEVRLRADRTIAVRNNLISTRLSADLLLGGTGREPALTGRIFTDEGSVAFADARLKLRSALVEFLPSDPLNPRLNITLGETLRGYEATVTITGKLDDPEVTLESTPPLEREKLLVLITTGQTVEQIEGRGVERFAAVEAAKYVGRSVIRYFSSGVPGEETFLSRFSIETASAPGPEHEDPLRVVYRVARELIFPRDEVFLQGERDAYGDYNFNAGFTFQVK